MSVAHHAQQTHGVATGDGSLWQQLAQVAPALAESGVTSRETWYLETDEGWDEFRCHDRSVSVWAPRGRGG